MNTNTRRQQQRELQEQAPPAMGSAVPPWSELRTYDADQVQALAEQLGIEFTNRAETLSAIHRAR